MAKIEALVPLILKWEGGYVNHPNDKGGETNKGITLATWKAFGHNTTQKIAAVKVGNKTYTNVTASLYNMTDAQWTEVLRKGFWDKCKADQITCQSIANIIVDWAWGSGHSTAIKQVQKLVGVTVDGIVGNKTIAAINSRNQSCLFDDIKKLRMAFYDAIVSRDPSQKVFLKGWQNRTNSFVFTNA